MVGNCGDCIHFEVCSVWNKKFIALRIKRQSVCEHFKNKADFVEVVRCEKCKHYGLYEHIEDFDGKCTLSGIEFDKDFHCSYGERSDT
jgi:hypothetical protein